MKIEVIYDKCIGCGECFAVCPDVFTLDDDGIALVKNDLPPLTEILKTKVERAKKICPTRAITISEGAVDART